MKKTIFEHKEEILCTKIGFDLHFYSLYGFLPIFLYHIFQLRYKIVYYLYGFLNAQFLSCEELSFYGQMVT